jgi:thiol-disulfide isomerase/thioredoxin
MAETPSTMLPLGVAAPDFRLIDAATGAERTLAECADGKPLVVMFLCNHCPFVIHVREEITRITREYGARGVRFVAINANSLASHPQDGPEHMKALVAELGWDFPFLFDADQSVAKAYRAACTPDFFLFDADRKLVYRGQFDDSRPGNGKPITGADLRAAVDAVLAGKAPSEEQAPSLGCNIKWRPGNEPTYAA